MKNFIFILLCCLNISCQTYERSELHYMSPIYMSFGVSEPIYLVLRDQPKVFEMHMPGIWEVSFGEWDIIKDTLYLKPEYEYFHQGDEFEMRKNHPSDLSIVTIAQKYAIKKDILIDKTDYNVVWQGDLSPLKSVFDLTNGEIYARIPKKTSVVSCQTRNCKELYGMPTIRRSSTSSNDLSYFIMRERPNVFEIHLPDAWEIILGEWKLINDTVYLSPKYLYQTKDNKNLVNEISPNDSALISFHRSCLRRKKLHIDEIKYKIINSESMLSDTTYIFNKAEFIKIPMKVSGMKERYDRLKRQIE